VRGRGRAAQALVRPGLKVVAETLDGFPGPVLEDRSASLGLLVLGTRALGPLRRVMLGSVSAHLVRHCGCPLLVVPRGPLSGDVAAGAPSAAEAAGARPGESPAVR
jgi:nucleotide-binding universal stress UspA family protein